MKLAKEMLNSDLYSIEEIAYQSGFNGLTGFSRKFKQEFNSSPSEYRKNALRQKPEAWSWKIPLDENYFNELIELKKKINGWQRCLLSLWTISITICFL
ncbi:DNA-binding domain-containing protein, AraC-type [Flavobacterium aquidurense]|uniref:DNA-binding domain-containing protein, AraC-type n=2 Tax=Flavobacterium aquidurense TaxID=362413 RepID=A0A0Q0RYP1_9FLAO|nr:DNA-binding domain-containing protein, AraC-type [Flavobacterium aquidurense]